MICNVCRQETDKPHTREGCFQALAEARKRVDAELKTTLKEMHDILNTPNKGTDK